MQVYKCERADDRRTIETLRQQLAEASAALTLNAPNTTNDRSKSNDLSKPTKRCPRSGDSLQSNISSRIMATCVVEHPLANSTSRDAISNVLKEDDSGLCVGKGAVADAEMMIAGARRLSSYLISDAMAKADMLRAEAQCETTSRQVTAPLVVNKDTQNIGVNGDAEDVQFQIEGKIAEWMQRPNSEQHTDRQAARRTLSQSPHNIEMTWQDARCNSSTTQATVSMNSRSTTPLPDSKKERTEFGAERDSHEEYAREQEHKESPVVAYHRRRLQNLLAMRQGGGRRTDHPMIN